MSDEEFEYEYDDDANDSPTAEDSGGGEDDVGIEIANAFYEADDVKARAPQDAIVGFSKVVALEKEHGLELEWSFKALTCLVLLHIQQGQPELMVDRYKQLLACIGSSKVTSNAIMEAINSVLDKLSVVALSDQDALATMYDTTLQALKAARIERMWFVVSVKLARLHVDAKRLPQACALIHNLHTYCTLPGGSDDPSKAAQLIEIYAMRIELVPMLKAAAEAGGLMPAGFGIPESVIYNRMQALIKSAAISDPRIMGGVHESFALLHMGSGDWVRAYDEFYAAFKCYSDSGNYAARRCLKYVVLANMLSLSSINPFDTQEAKVYKDDPEVFAMWRLREAYAEMDFQEFHRTLHNPRNRIASDELIVKYIAPLNRQVVLSVIKDILKSYSSIRLEFLAQQVNESCQVVEGILVAEILDGRLDAKIDQVAGVLLLKQQRSSSSKYGGMRAWATQLTALTASIQLKAL